VLRLALQSAIVATLFVTATRAEDTKAEVPKQELQAKMAYCQVCHGPSGQGFRGYYAIPRLAGQQPEYFENQLQAFIDRRRTKPLGGAPKDLIDTGKKIYQDGIPSADVPACASCHGPEAKGDGQFPRLAGQLNDYIFNKLTNWSKERGQNPSNPDASSIMEPIAHGLNKQQIEAVAAYVSYLE
jgi:cytochrome c553